MDNAPILLIVIGLVAFLCAVLFAYWFLTRDARRILRRKAVVIWSFEQLQPGDHISIRSSLFGYDHGIIVEVINRKCKVLMIASYSIYHGYQSNTITFAKGVYGTRIYRYEYDFYSSFRRDVVMQRVKEAQKSKNQFFSNGAFIEWCKCGIPGYNKIWLTMEKNATPRYNNIRHVDELKKGDHVAVAINWLSRKHGIITDITPDGNASIATLSDEGAIVRMECDLQLLRGRTRRFDYIKCLEMQDTFGRISVYEKHLKTDMYFESDEEFCVWCKTGRALPAATATLWNHMNGDDDPTGRDVSSTDGNLDKYIFRQHWASGVHYKCGGPTVVSVRNISKYDAETLLKNAGFTGLVIKEATMSVYIKTADIGGNYNDLHRTRSDNVAYVRPPVASGDDVIYTSYNVKNTALFTGAIGSKGRILYGLTVGHLFDDGPDLTGLFVFAVFYALVHTIAFYFQLVLTVPSLLLTSGCAIALYIDDSIVLSCFVFLYSALYIWVVKNVVYHIMPYTAVVGVFTFIGYRSFANMIEIWNLYRLNCPTILPNMLGTSSVDMAFLALNDDANVINPFIQHDEYQFGVTYHTDDPVEVQIITGYGTVDGRIVSLGSENQQYSNAYEIVTSQDGEPNRTSLTNGESGGLVVSGMVEERRFTYGMVLGKFVALSNFASRMLTMNSPLRIIHTFLEKLGLGNRYYRCVQSLMNLLLRTRPERMIAICDKYTVGYSSYTVANSFHKVLEEIDRDAELSTEIPNAIKLALHRRRVYRLRI